MGRKHDAKVDAETLRRFEAEVVARCGVEIISAREPFDPETDVVGSAETGYFPIGRALIVKDWPPKLLWYDLNSGQRRLDLTRCEVIKFMTLGSLRPGWHGVHFYAEIGYWESEGVWRRKSEPFIKTVDRVLRLARRMMLREE